ncbi:glutathione S-transferase family protein [Pararoseomonas indoligenes]|uniref:Glutathione S-transferase family protein n=1 Tax=Roseomonas indoligenes TaxID=2820811 RepID=A0A940MZU6_9PROT|nr:glutathione S-transferase family protein [Pararoseomonas indoligenes]MBP0494192.1 glutathione S-transferase family protein [Pararoseomonas indoligenes]
MGLLVDGQWQDRWIDTKATGGRFIRKDSAFRHWVTPDGSPGPSGEGGFAAEPGRYHLYVSLACPWAHRALILRARKGLEGMIGLSVVHWHMGEDGWTFEDGPGVIPDPVNHARFLHQVYTAADPHYTGRVTVPVLWDKHRGTIVNNESAEIIRMLDHAFDGVGAKPGDHAPHGLLAEIDEVNASIYDAVNNGVYKAGFATAQPAYEEAARAVFAKLDELDAHLAAQRYLVGNVLTEADIRLFTTLVRFDLVYHGHFKCNRRRIADYPALFAYLRDLFQSPGFGETCDFLHMKRHYYESHPTINPTGIVPIGPEQDLLAPHGREALG